MRAPWTATGRRTPVRRCRPAEEIARLEAQPGGPIVAAGGTTFLHALITLGVVDEYRLWARGTFPGEDRVRFEAGKHPTSQ